MATGHAICNVRPETVLCVMRNLAVRYSSVTTSADAATPFRCRASRRIFRSIRATPLAAGVVGVAIFVAPFDAAPAFDQITSIMPSIVAAAPAMCAAPVTANAAILSNNAHDRAPAVGLKTSNNSNIRIPSVAKFPSFPLYRDGTLDR